MASPGNMKTGLNVGMAHENMFPETFFIIYLILGAILRRCGFKDCLVYSEHNSIGFKQDTFDSGVLFNLFSEYGVGKSLEPLIHELFSTITLDAKKNKNNVFFQEIVRLTNTVSRVVRSHNPALEAGWMMNYAMSTNNLIDSIAVERETRLAGLFGHSYDSEDITDQYDNEEDSFSYDEDNLVEVIIDAHDKICYCDFCFEFRKYHLEEGKNVGEILKDVLARIAKDVNRVQISMGASVNSNNF